jgi:type II secretory pathway component PulF
MQFNYQARTKDGRIQVGVVEAASSEAAASLLQKYGLYVTLLEEVKTKPVYAKTIKLFSKVSSKDLVMFSRQLSILFKSKIPLVESLEVLTLQTKKPVFREKIGAIAERVEAGVTLSAALAEHPKLFSAFYVSMVKSGESSGKLSEALEYLADHLEKEYELVSKIRGAMIYPALVLAVVVVVLFLVMFFIVPSLTKVLEETGQELPLITRITIGFSNFLRKLGWVFLGGTVALIFAVFYSFRTAAGKAFLDKVYLKLPLFGSFFRMVYLSRFAENLSTLISGGLPIAVALEISGEVVGNTVYKNIINKTRDEVRKGESIGSVLERYPSLFPPVFTQMTLIGEKTGTLDSTLTNLVSFYRKEVDRAVVSLLSIIEPVLVIFLGLIVTGIIASVLLPLYNMSF